MAVNDDLGFSFILYGEPMMQKQILDLLKFLAKHKADIIVLGLIGWAALAQNYPFDNLQPVYAN